MAESMQSLDQLSQLKPATPEAPKYVKKLDKQGRAYATGKRKDAVARVWIKPGPGKILINTRTEDVYFARPVLRMLIARPLVRLRAVTWAWAIALGAAIVATPIYVDVATAKFALRSAFERMVKDPIFLAEMERTGTEVSFMSGVEIERLIARVYGFPPQIVAKMVDAISSRGR